MKLYMHPLSQHSRRVLILAYELGIDIEPIPVALQEGEHKSDEYARKSVTGRVPLLEDGDFRLPESHAIMRYLCDREKAERLYPADARMRARIDLWLDWTHATLNPPVQTVMIEAFFKGEHGDKALIAASRERAKAAFDVLERGKDTFPILTPQPNIADIAIATTLALHEMAGGEFAGTPGVAAWFETFKRRPSFLATAPTMN